MVLAKGTLLHGSYEIVNVLGQGGFAVTYEARHIKLNTNHAIKEYFPRGVAERSGKTVRPAEGEENRDNFARGLDSFLREAQTITRFSHPNIVAVQDYFQENGTAYLVMPYLAGETLQTVLKRCPGSKMKMAGIKQWLMPLLDGLATLHADNFLHRDIKPSNIYITGNATPILIDFGSARSTLGQLTHGLTVVLTPEYAPPEQHTAIASSQGPWTDIYAVGAVMYRCLMGKAPADSNTRQLAVINGEKDPVEAAYSELAAASDPEVARIITQCLDLNSKKRIRTVRELQRRLAKPSVKDYRPASPVQRSAVTPEKKKESHAGLYILIILAIGLVIAMYASSGGNKNSGYSGGQYSQTSPKNSGSSSTNDDAKNNCLEIIRNGEIAYYEGFYDVAEHDLKIGVDYTCYRYKDDRMRGTNILGKVYEKKGKYEEAVKMYQDAVDGGYNPARYNLARCYRDGLGVTKNEQTAYKLFLEAAQKGDGDACVKIGENYENNKNYELALGWYEDALKKGTNDKDIQIHIDRVKKKLLRTALN